MIYKPKYLHDQHRAYLLPVIFSIFVFAICLLTNAQFGTILFMNIIMSAILSFLLTFLFFHDEKFILDIKQKLIITYYDFFGLKIRKVKVPFDNVAKTTIKRSARSKFRYGQKDFSDYQLWVTLKHPHRTVLMSNLSKRDNFKEITRDVNSILSLHRTGSTKKKRIKNHL